MNFAAVIHRSTQQFIYPVSRNELAIQLFTAAGDVEHTTLLYWERSENDPMKIIRIPLKVSLRDSYRDCYRIHIKTPGIAAYIRYCFELESDRQKVWFGRDGFEKTYPTMYRNFFEFLWPNPTDAYNAPPWSREQIYYQIFPERFNDGDPALTPKGAVPWGSTPTRENYMGGDLPGIIQKLDYLSDLGITCLYLTPIFKGTSNHKYDTVDYYRIDPSFGTEQDFQRLVADAHAKGIRILLDGVFNHCGFYFPFFQDVIKKGNDSAYSDWFFIHSFPVQTNPCNYDCVGHYQWMPKINLANQNAQEYFTQVGLYWVRTYGIDGWRLDVADEIPTAFWEHFSAILKKDFPDILLLGETWGDAERLVSINRLDSAMNYLFKDAVTDWLAKERISVQMFDHLVNHMLSLYPDEVNCRMYNLLDSHDTPRFLFDCGGDIRKLKMAVALQMAFPGCPAIFYGDEVGVSGDNDPLCRQAMVWERGQQDTDLRNWYKAFIRLRKMLPALQFGNYQTVLCDSQNNLYGFLRETKENRVLVFLNPGSKDCKATIEFPILGPTWEEVLSAQADCMERPLVICSEMKYPKDQVVELPAYSVKIYNQKEKV